MVGGGGGGAVGLYKYKSNDNVSWRIYGTSKDVCFFLRTSKETSLDEQSILQESLSLRSYLWTTTEQTIVYSYPNNTLLLRKHT